MEKNSDAIVYLASSYRSFTVVGTVGINWVVTVLDQEESRVSYYILL
jgi:hypothetical protein